MSNTPETKVKKEIKKYLKRLSDEGQLIYSEVREAGGYQFRKGLPDMWALINGVHLEIEIKRPDGGRRSTMQLKWAEIFDHLGVPYCCVDSPEQLDDVIKKLGLIN